MTSKRKETDFYDGDIKEKRARLQKELKDLDEVEQSNREARMREQMKKALKGSARVLRVAKKSAGWASR